MWYVISTPHPDEPEEEEVWECPSNWIINGIVHYPPSDGKKSRKSLLDQIKRKEEPELDWVKTSKYKFIKTMEGNSSFETFKEAAKAKADEVLRKDTSDDSDALIQIQTRDQKSVSKKEKRKISDNDFNGLATKLLKDENEASLNIQETETVEEINTYLENFGDDKGGPINDQESFYQQFLSEDEIEKENFKKSLQNENYSEDSHIPKPTKVEVSQTYAESTKLGEAFINAANPIPNLMAFDTSDQILSISCSGCVQNSKDLADIRKTQLLQDQKIEEIKSLVVALKIDGFNVQNILQSIKGDTSAVLSNFDPNENPLASIVPDFELPIDNEETLTRFNDKLGKDELFQSIVVSNFARKYVSEDNLKGNAIIGGIMKELVTDELLQKYSLRGIKRKDIVNIRFDVYTNIFEVIYKMYIYAQESLKRIKEKDCITLTDVESKVSEFIRHAKERLAKKARKDGLIDAE